MFFILPILLLGVTGLFLMVRAACSAPEGEEDSQGFHLISPRESESTGLTQANMLSASELVFFQR